MWELGIYDRVALYEIENNSGELSSSVEKSPFALFYEYRLLYYCSAIVIKPTGTTAVLRFISPPPQITLEAGPDSSRPFEISS
jgi:hypothetical protein